MFKKVYVIIFKNNYHVRLVIIWKTTKLVTELSTFSHLLFIFTYMYI